MFIQGVQLWKLQLFAYIHSKMSSFFHLKRKFYSSFYTTPATLYVFWFLFFLLYQFLVHWSRVASPFCCRLNRLVLDDRSKILTTSGEKHDAQPGRERRRPDRSTGLHRGDGPLDKGEPCLTALVDQVRISPSASYKCQCLFAGVCMVRAWTTTVWRLSLHLLLICLSTDFFFLNQNTR